MILLPAIILSIIIVMVSLIKRLNKKKIVNEERPNMELELYFIQKSEGASNPILLKQLLKAAVCFKERVSELEKEMEILGSLYDDRMISEDHWDRINEENKNYELEKMCIQSEANILRSGYGGDIFKEAGKISAVSGKKSKPQGDNSLYQKKKEILEVELMKKLGISNQA